jgi:hypothetical protein
LIGGGLALIEFRKPLTILAIIGMIGALVVFSFVVARRFVTGTRDGTTAIISAYIRRSLIAERQFQLLSKRVRYNEFQLKRIQAQVSRLSKPSDESKFTGRLNGMEQSIRQLEDDQSKIEDALLESPAKALQLPLLAREMESDRRANEAALLAVRGEIDRQNSFMQWVFGTFAVSVVGLILTVVLPVLRGSETKSS